MIFEAPPEGRFVVGDPVRLRQILTNFVNNAIKFTDAGEIKIKVALAAAGDGMARLRFDVRDTGIGIPKDKLSLLFQKFTQVDGSLARRHGGSGLGLAICRELAALMGGEVGVETVEGRGSVFFAQVPCEIARADGWETPPDDCAAPPVPEDEGAPARLSLLVAEDHPVNQSLFRAMLDRLGHDCVIVSDGAQAVEAVQRAQYDIVLLDAHMPVMDGTEAAAHIRALGGAFVALPLIVVTADAMVGDRERYLAAGMDDYITKPVDMAELAAVLARHAPAGRPRRAPAPSIAGAAE